MTTQPMAEPSHPISAFDPEIIWELHKKKIIVAAIVVLLVLIGGGGYLAYQAFENQKAAGAYAGADSVEAWRSVISRYPGSVAAGNSYLRIAAQLRSEGKYSDSDNAYDTFVHQFPKHALLVSGYLGLAGNAELEKDTTKALNYYKQIVDQHGTSYEAPMALYNQGRLTEEAATPANQQKDATPNNLQQAQALFESVVTRYPTSIAAQLAESEAKSIAEKLAQAAPAANASPAQPATPAASISPAPATPQP